MTPHRCLIGGLLPSDAWFKRAGIWVTPGPFTGSSMGPASDGRLNSSVRFLGTFFCHDDRLFVAVTIYSLKCCVVGKARRPSGTERGLCHGRPRAFLVVAARHDDGEVDVFLAAGRRGPAGTGTEPRKSVPFARVHP